jgi:hypothetical protein
VRPELCITAAYGNILPQRFLDIPPYGTSACQSISLANSLVLFDCSGAQRTCTVSCSSRNSSLGSFQKKLSWKFTGTRKLSRLVQRHGLQNITLTSCFYKNIY